MRTEENKWGTLRKGEKGESREQGKENGLAKEEGGMWTVREKRKEGNDEGRMKMREEVWGG